VCLKPDNLACLFVVHVCSAKPAGWQFCISSPWQSHLIPVRRRGIALPLCLSHPLRERATHEYPPHCHECVASPTPAKTMRVETKITSLSAGVQLMFKPCSSSAHRDTRETVSLRKRQMHVCVCKHGCMRFGAYIIHRCMYLAVHRTPPCSCVKIYTLVDI
jgi:hypothetical protein